jgi:hypothetical protein
MNDATAHFENRIRDASIKKWVVFQGLANMARHAVRAQVCQLTSANGEWLESDCLLYWVYLFSAVDLSAILQKSPIGSLQ